MVDPPPPDPPPPIDMMKSFLETVALAHGDSGDVTSPLASHTGLGVLGELAAGS